MAHPEICRTLNDPAVSDWLKRAIEDLILRDPVDAANDTEFLAKLMSDRAQLSYEIAARKIAKQPFRWVTNPK